VHLPDMSEMLKSLVVIAVQGGVFVFVVVLAVLDRRRFKQYYRTGLLIGLACFGMVSLSTGLALAHIDLSAFMDRFVPSEGLLGAFFYVGLFIGFCILVLRIGWHMVLYYVAAAEWSSSGRAGFPLLEGGGDIRWRGMAGAAAFGVGAAVVSTVIFLMLGVEESEPLQRMGEMLRGVGEVSPAIRIPIVLLAISVPAIVEELAYRGVLLGFLVRHSGGRRGAIVASVVGVSLLWALIHLMNTDAPLVKLSQIFVVGVVLCEFARRVSVEAAIAGHLGLNLAAGMLALVVEKA